MNSTLLLISGILSIFISSVILLFNSVYIKDRTIFFIMIAIIIAGIIELLFSLFIYLYTYKKKKNRNHN